MLGSACFVSLPCCCALLCGCRYNFIPVIPAPVQVALPLRITQATLQRRGDALALSARVDGPMQADYLSVVWFAGDRELGRDSRYLDAQHRSAEFELPAAEEGRLPGHAALRRGAAASARSARIEQPEVKGLGPMGAAR